MGTEDSTERNVGRILSPNLSLVIVTVAAALGCQLDQNLNGPGHTSEGFFFFLNNLK